MVLLWILDGSAAIAEAGIILPAIVGQIVFGIKFRQRSFWAAAGVMTMYLYGAVWTSITYGFLSGILLKIIIATVYVRGFLAVDTYLETDKAIRAMTSSSAGPL